MQSADGEAASGALLATLRERIRRAGPLRIDEYMAACLGDPRHGYWRKADTIGASGDFITAPEISQVFGELIGLWCAVTWRALGQPAPLQLVELGPGRGTLMRDLLRAARAAPQFLSAANVHLIEISEPLRSAQRSTLGNYAVASEPRARDSRRLPGAPQQGRRSAGMTRSTRCRRAPPSSLAMSSSMPCLSGN